MTFAHNGRQYVAVLSGGNALIGSPRGDSVWLFGLGGTLDEAQPGDTPLLPQLAVIEEEMAAPDLANGAELYQQTCVQCHGDDGKGGHGGGAPLNALDNLEQIMTVVREGRNNMPPLGLALTAGQIHDVSAWIMATFSTE